PRRKRRTAPNLRPRRRCGTRPWCGRRPPWRCGGRWRRRCGCGRRRRCGGRRACTALEVELTDTCVPVETAVCRLVFVHVPESHTVRWIDGSHAIITPAVRRLVPRAGKHCSFALTEVTGWIASKTPRITNARQQAGAGDGITDSRVP